MRKRRYERDGHAGKSLSLTPRKRALLRHLIACRLLSLPQLAALEGLDPKAARKHLRPLYDAGLVEVIVVTRAALDDPQEGESELSLVFGSAPNLYCLTRAGLRLLYDLGEVGAEERERNLPSYGPRNALFLAHDVQVRDLRVFLVRTARERGGRLILWHDGPEAHIDLGKGVRPQVARPDARFQFEVRAGDPGVALAGFIELDRGTERGGVRWREKVAQYRALLGNVALVQQATGKQRARVLVVVPSESRRRWLREFLRREIPSTEDALRQAFYLCLRRELLNADATAPIWQVLDGDGPQPRPLIPEERFI